MRKITLANEGHLIAVSYPPLKMNSLPLVSLLTWSDVIEAGCPFIGLNRGWPEREHICIKSQLLKE